MARGVANWNEIAEKWDAEGDQMWQTGQPRGDLLRHFLQLIDQNPKRVLDFGCGPGASTQQIALQGHQAIGVDISPAMIAAAKRRGVEAYVSNSHPLPFPSHSFGAVFTCTALEWTERPAELVQEMARVLQPGGLFVAVILGPNGKPRWLGYPRLYGEEVLQNMMMPWELHRLLTEHGLQMVGTKGIYPDTLPTSVISALSDNWAAQAAIAKLFAFVFVKQ